MIAPYERAVLRRLLAEITDEDRRRKDYDPELIVAAVNALPALLDALDAQDALLDEALEMLLAVNPLIHWQEIRVLTAKLAERSKKPTPIRVCSSCGKSFQTDSLNYHFYCKECKP
jgi:hypothetical protein